jgi:16S rRNA (uracil1498-N3)-methyltransferase
VEKCVELGVTRLVPLITDRSEKQSVDKLGRYVIEASKQCGRNRLMEIADPVRWSDWLATVASESGGLPRRSWVAHPGGKRIAGADFAEAQPTTLAIGPEGGLTDEEADEATEAGWELIGLGPRILRIETAALSLAALLSMTASMPQTHNSTK